MASASLHAWGRLATGCAAWHKPVRHDHKRQLRFLSICAPVRLSDRAQRNSRLLASSPTSAHASLSDLSALEAEEGWNGAVVYRRDAKQFEFSIVTSLERLALPHLSSPLSRELSQELLCDGVDKEDEHQPLDDGSGLRSKEDEPRGVKSQDEGETLVTVDFCVHRVGRDLHLEGEAETVFALQCHR